LISTYYFLVHGQFLNCDGECIQKNSTIKETWLCVDQCQSWLTPCKEKCPPNLKKNCAGLCEEKDKFTSYLCNNECVAEVTPCRGSCQNKKILCNGKCQEETLQCDGECLDGYYKFASCDGTCSEVVSKDPNECCFVKEVESKATKKCTLPFQLNGLSHYGCIADPEFAGKFWCSTKDNGDESRISGSWGHCGQGCYIGPKNISECFNFISLLTIQINL